MANITFKGKPIHTSGDLPPLGTQAPDFQLINDSLETLSLASFAGKKVLINIFPSIDTGICALQVKNFAQQAAAIDNTALLFISLDLPFAQKRFCAAEGIENAVTASDFRHHSIAESYGIHMTDGPLAGLYARATIVLDETHSVKYTELVPEIAQEPNYEAAIAALK